MSERLSALPLSILSGVYKSFANDPYFRLVVGIVFTWGFLDTVTTFIAIGTYGSIEYELNPITAWMLHIHPAMLIVGKSVAVGAVAFLALRGRASIKEVYGWRAYFHLIVWVGMFVAVMNMYAAYTAITGHDPLFT